MARRLKHDVPDPDWRVATEAVREVGPLGVFAPELPSSAPLVVEIGFGRGEFLMDQAERAPGTAFLGVEVSHKRVVKMARRLARGPLRNVRLLEAPAEYVAADLLPPASVQTFWVNFPDPWPKKRHHRRRLLQPGLIGLLAERLTPGGRLEVATDHAEYAAWIAEVLAGEPRLANVLAPAAWAPEIEGRMQTAYEEEWRRLGRPLHFFRYRRPERAEGGAATAAGSEARASAATAPGAPNR